MTTEEKKPEGWGGPWLAKKFHYFRGAESLCGRWLFTGQLEPVSGVAPCRA